MTIGEGDEAETYQTAAEDEEVTVQVNLGRNEVLQGVYYNDEEGTEAEYTQEGDNIFIRMLRGGAMLLGLDIGKKPSPAPDMAANPTNAIHSMTITGLGSFIRSKRASI